MKWLRAIGEILFFAALIMVVPALMIFLQAVLKSSFFSTLSIVAVFIFYMGWLFRLLGKGSIRSFLLALTIIWLCFSVYLSVNTYGWMYETFIVFIVCSIIWLIAGAGIFVAGKVQSRWPSKRVRRICIFGFPILFLSICLGFWLYDVGMVAYSGKRTSMLSEPALKCNANELCATKVVPESHVPLLKGTNLIWCASFPLAWNELTDFIGEEVRFDDDEPECVSYLNQRLVGSENQDIESCFAVAGAYTPEFISRLNSELKSKFGAGTFSPESLPASNGPDQLAAFGYLSVNLPFKYTFQRAEEPLLFRGVPVESFTIPFGDGSLVRKERAKQQVLVCYPPEEESFIVELLTRKTDHHLILARISPEATLDATVDKVCGYVDSLPLGSLEENQELEVPLFNFDITREYTELIGNSLNVSKYKGWSLEKAGQNIRFQLDERGAALQSRTQLLYAFCISRQHCIFDEPFLLMLRYKDSPQPYFAMWVDNAEILVKTATEL